MNVLVKEGILGAILLIMGVFDRLYIDWHWVGRTKVWIIPGTELCCRGRSASALPLPICTKNYRAIIASCCRNITATMQGICEG